MASPRNRSFREYYNRYLHAIVRRTERRRYALLVLLLCLAGTVLTGLYAAWYYALPGLWLLYFVWIAVAWRIARSQTAAFRRYFKATVLPPMVRHANPTYEYRHDAYISADLFAKSHLFLYEYDLYEGEDYVKGRSGQVDFELSELNVMRLAEAQDRWKIVFRGIFMHAYFPTHLGEQCIVVPTSDWEHHIRTLQDITARGGRELLAQPADFAQHEEFNRLYMVYAVDNRFHPAVLSPRVMEQLLHFHRVTGKKILCSVQGRHLFLAYFEPRDVMEPSVWRSNARYELLAEHYSLLEHIIALIKHFDVSY